MQHPTEIKIYGLAPFDRSGKARWLLEEMGVAYKDHWLDRDSKENESAAYLRLNPMGRVPTAEIDGQPFSESGAICAHLADLFSDKGFAPRLDSSERALYQQWMYFASATLDTLQIRIMVIEDIPEGKVRTEKETALINDMKDVVETLDRTLSKNPFLLGKNLSAADICVSYHLYWLTLWPELVEHIKKAPALISYLNRMKERPAALKAKVFSYEE